MKSKYLMLMIIFLTIFTFGPDIHAQTLTTDIVFLKVGWIPQSTVDFDETGWNDPDFGGFAIQGEYNLNFNNFWLGFGVEYQRLVEKDNSAQFILPMISAKLAAMGGLYVGVGLAGKYMIAADEYGSAEWEKKIDLWVNGILGYYMPIAEAVFLDIEGRFGYNLTKQQFSEYKSGGTTYDVDIKSQYDIAFYVGIGYRAAMSNY